MSARFYRRMYKIFAGGVRWLFNVRVSGAENEPAEGGYIVCANHLSDADVVIVAASLKRQVRFFAKAELFRVPLLKQLITALGAYPVERGKNDVGAIKRTLSILEGGEVVGIYPQGTRCPGVDPRSTKIKNGVAMMMHHSGVPALPVCIQTSDFKIRPFHRTWVRVGKPVTPEELNITEGEYSRAAREVFDRVCALLEDGDGK